MDDLDWMPELPDIGGADPVANSSADPDLPHTRIRGDRDVPRGLNGGLVMNTKWDLSKAFGLPLVVSADMVRQLYRRSGSSATAAVNHIYRTCWQTDPVFRRTPDGGDMDPQEKLVNDVMNRLWHKVHDGDRRSLVGRYAALILRIADGQPLSAPVRRVRGGIEGLVDIIPVSDTDLRANVTDTDKNSPTYGEVEYYEYRAQDANGRPLDTLRVHPDRVIILSRDGTMRLRPFLEPVYNAIQHLEKLEGAIAEGALKDARMLMHFNVDTMAKLAGTGVGGLAQAVPVTGNANDPTLEQVAENITEQIDAMNSRYENAVSTKGVTSTVLRTQMRELAMSVWSLRAGIASGVNIPMRILFGSQSGERASGQDRKEFHQSMDARRGDEIVPRLNDLLDRLVKWGMIDGQSTPWRVSWAPLAQESVEEKREKGTFMVAANAEAANRGEIVYTADEIRAVTGHEPLERAQIESQEKLFEGLLEKAEEPLALPSPDTEDDDTTQNTSRNGANGAVDTPEGTA